MSDSQLTYEVYEAVLFNWMDVSTNVLAIFEYLMTLDQEVSYIWKRKKSGATLLLIAVRYTMLGMAVSDLAGLASLSSKGCEGVLVANIILELLGFVLIAVFSGLRVYALRSHDVKLSAVVFLLQLSPVAINLASSALSTFNADPFWGCSETVSYGSNIEYIFKFTARIPITVGDVLVVIMTWLVSFGQFKAQRELGINLSLSTILFRDGTAYFLILLVLNVLEMCPPTTTWAGPLIGTLTTTLPLILINRFMLNLRQSDDTEAHSAGHIRTISTLMFKISVDVAGNMGEPLEHGWEERDGDEPEIEEIPRYAEET